MTIAEQLKRAKADLDAVYEAGKKAGGGGGGDNIDYYDVFWDACQDEGKRTIYQYLFVGEGWTNKNFKPKYDIVPSRANYMFQYAGITDLQDALEKAGVVLDFSEVSGNYITRPFANSTISRVGVIDLSHVTASINTFFTGASELVTVGLWKLSENGTNTFGKDIFQSCAKLANITIDGVINADLNMSACPLTTTSVQSIIDHLKDLTGTTTKTLTLSSKASITDAQEAEISAKNWTLVI